MADGTRNRRWATAPGVTEPKKLRYLFSRPWNGTLYSDANLPLGSLHIGD